MRKSRGVLLLISSLVALTGVIGAAPVAPARLKVTSFPSRAEVLVDGVNTGKLTPTNITLSEGDHVVTIQIPGSGWQTDTRTLTLVAGRNHLIVTLMPAVAVGPPGPKGDKGDPGEKGDPGDKGDKGDPGGTARADGPCFDNVNRYIDCGNGTVTDTVTGLIWLKDAACFGYLDWAAANGAATALANGQCGLTDNSSQGDWRLPAKGEWSATIARAVAMGCTGVAHPSLTDDAGTACYGDGAASSLTGVGRNALELVFFWTGTTHEALPNLAWGVHLGLGIINEAGHATGAAAKASVDNHFRTWPVRSGAR